MINRSIAITSVLLTLTACATTSQTGTRAKIYGLDGGSYPLALDSGLSGSMSMIGPSGESFAGDFTTNNKASVGYAGNGSAISGPVGSTGILNWPGQVFLSGNKGTTIQCAYTVNIEPFFTRGAGAGDCQDNKGKKYRLVL